MATNPAKRGALRALGLLMTATILIGSPTALGHDIYPQNILTNGGFESSFAGWNKLCFADPTCPVLSIATSGACVDSKALVAVNQFAGGFVRQTFPVANGYSLLDVSIRVLANPGNPGPNALQVSAGASMVARLTVASNAVSLKVYNNHNTPSGWVTYRLSNPGECHHIQVVLNEVAKTGTLLVDGNLAGTATGLATSATGATSMIIGDFAGYDTNPGAGAAPDVMWDGLYFGPRVCPPPLPPC